MTRRLTGPPWIAPPSEELQCDRISERLHRQVAVAGKLGRPGGIRIRAYHRSRFTETVCVIQPEDSKAEIDGREVGQELLVRTRRHEPMTSSIGVGDLVRHDSGEMFRV